jgi:hypothetical protein
MREGVSAAQFIRDATMVRTAYAMGQRGDEGFEEALARVRPRPDADPPERGAQRRQALLDAAAAVKDSDRLDALRATGLLDSEVTPSFDRLARLAARVLNAPVALVSLVDADRQFFKSCLGLPEPWTTQRGTPLSHSFCQHAVASREPLIVADSREHELLRDNPRHPRHRRDRLRGHPAHRRRRARAGHALRHRQPAAALDDRPDPAAQRPRRIRRHGDRLRHGGGAWQLRSLSARS